MAEEYYSNILLINWVLLLISGGYFLLGKVPNKPVYESYRTSRRIMGIALLIFCVHFFIHWKFEFRDNAPQIAAAFNISSYYLAGILFGMSFISLLDHSYINRRRTISDLSKWGLLSAMVWCSVLYLDGLWQQVVLIFAAVLFFADIVRISLHFFRTYKKSVEKMQNYYSEDIDMFIRWMSRSTFGTIAMGLTGAVMAFMPKWMTAIYAALGIILFVYIFVCFMDYLIDSDKVETAVADSEPPSVAENTPEIVHLDVEPQLEKWIAKMGYLEQGITIEQLAIEVGTNRTYLSSYINNKYSCSFRRWIVGLRIDQAKLLLLDNSNYTIAQVAEMVGFTSGSYFGSRFAEIENTTPAKWREAHQTRIAAVHSQTANN